MTDTLLKPRRRIAVTAPLDGEPSADAPLCRFVWLKRSALVAAPLVAFAIASWWVWGVRASRRLNAEVAMWQQKGLPILRSDFATTAVPDDHNAAVLIRAAVRAVVPSEHNLAGNLSNPQAMPWPPAILRAAEASLAAEHDVIEQARAISSRKEVDWGRPSSELLVLNPGPDGFESYGKLRYIASDLELDGQVAAQRREGERLVDDALAAEMLGCGVSARPRIIAPLVGYPIRAIGASLIYDYAYRVPLTGPARPKARRLIAAFLAGGPLEGVERVLCSEGGYMLENLGGPALTWRSQGGHMEAVKQGPVGQAISRLLDPATRGDTAVALAGTRGAIAAARAPTWAAGQALAVQRVPLHPSITAEPAASILAGYTGNPSSDYRPFLTIGYHGAAARRMAAIVLACHLYREDHGPYPPSLPALVPDYLPAVPTDPFSPTGAPLGYRKDASGEPFVYSVMEAQVDLIAAGSFAPTVAQHADPRSRNFVLYLNPSRPMPAAALPAGYTPPPPATTAPAGASRK